MSRQLNSNGQIEIPSDQSPDKNPSDQIQSLSVLIRCLKDRQQLYFQLLSFMSKNIQSTSSMIDQMALFDRFVNIIRKKQGQLKIAQETILLNQNNNPCDRIEKKAFKRISVKSKKLTTQNTGQQQSKDQQTLRLFSRIMQILQGSISKARRSVVNNNNRMVRQFTKFKHQININFSIVSNPSALNPLNPSYKLLQKEEQKQDNLKKFNVQGFIKLVTGYITAKFKRQFDKVQKYLDKLQNGQDVAFKDLVIKKRGDGSDMSQQSVASKNISPKKKRLDTNSESPVKKSSAGRKGSKNKHRVLSKKQKEEDKNSEVSQLNSPKKTKQNIANKLLKFYNFMQLNKKQFLQDFIYEKNKQEEHRLRLFNSLMEKNKLIRQQIKQYNAKTINYEQKIKANKKNLLQVSSDENGNISRNESSAASKISLRTSFVISKRRASFQLQKDSSDNKSGEQGTQRQIKLKVKNQSENPLSKTMKSVVTPRRKASSSTNKKSKRIFVVKPPMLFQDEIPKAPVTQTTWMQNPITFHDKQMIQLKDKQRDRKRNEPIRLKKRNNPFPLQNTFLPQTFQYNSSRYNN